MNPILIQTLGAAFLNGCDGLRFVDFAAEPKPSAQQTVQQLQEK